MAEYIAPKSLLDPSKKQTFCPGCGHGIVVRLLHELIWELGYEDNNFFILGVGCSCHLCSMACGDYYMAPHGRASAAATGAKRIRPDMLTISYQGDGDAAVIGFSETMNAAYRNENITLVMINNTNFGMTGGQMSWTTMPGEVTATSIYGRDCDKTGYPVHLPEMMANSFSHIAYAARGSVHDVKHINETKKYLKNALEAQIHHEGYSMVEVLCQCPTNWHMSPVKAQERIKNELIPEYPLGEFKKRGEAK